ncbi:MAG: glycosyltransferase family 4 protein [Sedimentisphaerales bacterium]|nr:glycosyltransferase family 4 protein [Sedimentisphaerales bacterium]
MRVFMLGWEFPPFISGGLGTACYGLTKAMNKMGLQVFFVLPKPVNSEHSTHVRMLSPSTARIPGAISFELEDMENVKFHAINSLAFSPYARPEEYQQLYEEAIRLKRLREIQESDSYLEHPGCSDHYGGDMFYEIQRYAASSTRIAMQEDFDVIHAHDWMTYPAGIAVAYATGKPLIIHVHSTEFDRSGENVNQRIYDIERHGMHVASKIIAVSHLTRKIVIDRYGVEPDKVKVVYNGVERNGQGINALSNVGIRKEEKIVLFLGRITMQKGPEYFLDAAKQVLDVVDNVKFVIAGSGDMMGRIIEMAAQMGIGQKVLFTGFLRGKDVEKVYDMADLYVMPSVSEPFGIAPLEALNRDVPVLISKQSGVSEVLTHVLKVDFWDTKEMANKIIAVLKHPSLRMTLREHGNFEVRKLRWEDAARKCVDVYNEMMMTV